MDAASAFDALKAGDIPAFIAAVEWDESEWNDVPAAFGVNDGPVFNGRFGAMVVGVFPHPGGKYEVALHNHTDGVEEAAACFAESMSRIHALLDRASAAVVSAVSMSDIPYTGGMYV